MFQLSGVQYILYYTWVLGIRAWSSGPRAQGFGFTLFFNSRAPKKFKLSKIELVYKKFKLSKIELVYKAKKFKVPPFTIEDLHLLEQVALGFGAFREGCRM